MMRALRRTLAACLAGAMLLPFVAESQSPRPRRALFNDSHFHLTNYVQTGNTVEEQLRLMGDDVPRSTLFGIPLQQTWSHENSGDYAPTYYLQSDAPLYYYSFTDAVIAEAWLSLPERDRARFDPMITGFNPADMYAADHIRRVLETYPGVFEGIGEFSIHKEFVSSKVAGDVASLNDPALDRILEFAGEVGLVVILHNDIDVPFAKAGAQPAYLDDAKALLARHPNATIIWAHTGLGRVVHPTSASADAAERPPTHLEILASILEDPAMKHVLFDISWDEVAKYVVSSPDATKRTAELLNRYPDRFLFGTDTVAPANREAYLAVHEMYQPLWSQLTPETSQKVRLENYERVFDRARRDVRDWEKANLSGPVAP